MLTEKNEKPLCNGGVHPFEANFSSHRASAMPNGDQKGAQTMADKYNPTAVESTWYDWWDSQGLFKPQFNANGEPNPKGSFVIPLPPPTINGGLHVGHALTVTVEDVLARWHRMLGMTTLFVPGFDHGGISTESVVEKRLYVSTGETRHSLGKEKFLEAAHRWKDDHLEKITKQLRRLGGSYDWSRTVFTMDKKLSNAVVEAFCRLHEDGIIYRAKQPVNWCVKLHTALSEVEVEHVRLDGRTERSIPGYPPEEKFEFGVMTSFTYCIEDSDEKIVVGTTRPETMLGDAAIAVHPNDSRYQHLHGKYATHPFVQRRIPIITEDVEMEVGSGAYRVTPGHSRHDYEIGRKHNLQFINILNDDGTLSECAGDRFKGMKRFHARVAVVQALKDAGLYVGAQEHPVQITICKKSGDIVETVLKSQWWVKCKPLAEVAMKRARAGELSISPDDVRDDWYRWLENVEDWCTSRQLWWGHQCPAYFVRIEGESQDRSDGKNWVVGRTYEQAMERAKALVGDAKFTIEQDEDVLDTFFSSALWPFSIMGWPENTPDLRRFFPSSILETGLDTLYFWVAPMVLVGLYLTGTMPFKEVFCHGMVSDCYGRKMGKSLGNGIDPLDVIQGLSLEGLHQKLCEGDWDKSQIEKVKAGQKQEYPNGIPQCGADALRFALCAYTEGSRRINVEVRRVEEYRKFCDKIFAAVKFALSNLGQNFVPESVSTTTGETLIERWILHKLNVATEEVNKQLAARNFKAATTPVYRFLSHELCDIYIEVMNIMTDESVLPSIRKSAQQTLYTCIDHGLRLLHPFMPFVTEELWQRLPRRPKDTTRSIMIASYPVFEQALVYDEACAEFERVLSVVSAVKDLAALRDIHFGIQVYIHARTGSNAALCESQLSVVTALIKGCKSVKVVRDLNYIPAECHSALVTDTLSVHIVVQDHVDLNVGITKFAKTLSYGRLKLNGIGSVEPRQEATNVRLEDKTVNHICA